LGGWAPEIPAERKHFRMCKEGAWEEPLSEGTRQEGRERYNLLKRCKVEKRELKKVKGMGVRCGGGKVSIESGRKGGKRGWGAAPGCRRKKKKRFLGKREWEGNLFGNL